MAYPVMGRPDDVGGPAGFTYAGVLVRIAAGAVEACSHADLLARLRSLRFTGWVAPREGDWVVAVPARPVGTVAARGRGVLGVGSALAADLDVPVLAVRVLRDRQLVIAAWRDGHQVARYVSDPSFDHEERSQLLTDPVGVESAVALAETCGRSNVAAELAALLDRGLDPESFIESERLAAVLALLQLPSWLVSVAALPRHLPTGPRRADFARLGAGATGPAGPVARWGSEWVRRWRRQPPVVPNPPRRRVDVDPWLL